MTDRLDPERVRLTLQHVARYRLTTPEAVRTVPALRLKTNANALAWLRRLVAAGRLGEAPLDHHGSYFHLTERGARDVRRKPHRGSRHAGPLSESAKARAFALLAFCRLSGINRERLWPDELRKVVPGFDPVGSASTYCAERTDDSRKLGFVRVDAGGFGRWDRILATLAADLRSVAAEPALRTLIAARAFEVTLVTVTPEKAERLRTALAEIAASAVPVRVVAVPRLLALMGTIRAPPH